MGNKDKNLNALPIPKWAKKLVRNNNKKKKKKSKKPLIIILLISTLAIIITVVTIMGITNKNDLLLRVATQVALTEANKKIRNIYEATIALEEFRHPTEDGLYLCDYDDLDRPVWGDIDDFRKSQIAKDNGLTDVADPNTGEKPSDSDGTGGSNNGNDKKENTGNKDSPAGSTPGGAWTPPNGTYPSNNNSRVKQEIMQLLVEVCNVVNAEQGGAVPIEPWYLLGVLRVECGGFVTGSDPISKMFGGNQNASIFKNTHVPFVDSGKNWSAVTTKEGKIIGVNSTMLGAFQFNLSSGHFNSGGSCDFIFNSVYVNGSQSVKRSSNGTVSVTGGTVVNQKEESSVPDVVRPNPYYLPDMAYAAARWYKSGFNDMSSKVDDPRYSSLNGDDLKMVTYALMAYRYHGGYGTSFTGSGLWSEADSMHIDFQLKGYNYKSKTRKIADWWQDGSHTAIRDLMATNGTIPKELGYSDWYNRVANSSNVYNKQSIRYGTDAINYGLALWYEWSGEIGYNGGGSSSGGNKNVLGNSEESIERMIALKNNPSQLPQFIPDWRDNINENKYQNILNKSMFSGHRENLNIRGTNTKVFTWTSNGQLNAGIGVAQGDPSWGKLSLGTGNTISASGCAITSFAIAASTLNGAYVNPLDVLTYFRANNRMQGGPEGTSASMNGPVAFNDSASMYGMSIVVPRNSASNYSPSSSEGKQALQKLKDNVCKRDHVAIVEGNGSYPFTSQHFIVVADYDIETDTFYTINPSGSTAKLDSYTSTELWGKLKYFRSLCILKKS